MSASPATAADNVDNQRFWGGIARLPEEAQRSFWDAGMALSGYIGENPQPIVLAYDTSKPPPGAAWWERALFYIGQSHYNQAVTNVKTAQVVAEGAGWLWGALQGDFNKSPTTGQIVTGGLISMIPIVDTVCDVRDVIANCLDLDSEEARQDGEKWMALGMSCLGFVPEIGSAVKTVAKATLRKGVRLLDLLKNLEWVEKNYKKLRIACPWGFAPIEWLRKFDWVGHARKAAGYAKKAFENALTKTEAAIRYAFGTVKERLTKLADLFKAVAAKIADTMTELGRRIKNKIDELLGRAKNEAGNYGATPGRPNKHGQSDHEPPKAPRGQAARLDESMAKYARPAEQRTAERLATTHPEFDGLTFKAPPPPDPGHDWYDNLGRKYDAMGDGTKAEFQSMNDFRRSIDSHLRKGNDFTVIDLTGYEPDQVADVKKYVDSLPLDKQAMIRRIGF